MATKQFEEAPIALKSGVWDHFAFPVNIVEGERNVDKTCTVCKHCDTKIKYSGGTSNMSTHLPRHHPALPVSASRGAAAKQKCNVSTTLSSSCGTSDSSLSPKPGVSGQLTIASAFKSKLPPTSSRAEAITRAIGVFIASDLRPFSVVESPGFKQMALAMEPRYTVPSRTHIAQKVIPRLYMETRERVVADLISTPMVAMTTDGWTSRATVSFITITAHTISDDFKMNEYVLQTRAMDESHTGIHIAEVLVDAVKEWQLTRPYGPVPVVTDNASNMTVAAREAEGIGPHIFCFAHTINLASQKGLKVQAVARILGRVRRVVAFFHRSTTAAALLKKKQELLQLPQHKLIADVATRWNSSYDMLQRYSEQQAAIMATLMDKDIRKNFKEVHTLAEDDMSNIDLLFIVLEVLKTVTTMLCEARRPTISLILPLKHQLLANMTPAADDKALIVNLKTAIRDDLAARYTEETLEQFLWEATALDPRFRAMSLVSDDRRHSIYSNLVISAQKVYFVNSIDIQLNASNSFELNKSQHTKNK